MTKKPLIISLHFSRSRYVQAVIKVLTGEMAVKKHMFDKDTSNKSYYPKIGLYRDPKDILMSTALREKGGADDPVNLAMQLHRFNYYQMWIDMASWIKNEEYFLFRYETWYGNDTAFVRSIASLFDINLTVQRTNQIAEMFTLEKIEEMDKEKNPDYRSIFGEAVSSSKRGLIGSWKEGFKEHHWATYNKYFKPYADLMGY